MYWSSQSAPNGRGALRALPGGDMNRHEAWFRRGARTLKPG